ncbi:MAG: hypothetical protein HYZ58_14410 [Acidobacteria bacterium]|nr:hypothetical protein [Acidobacteriota bacterium]
MRIFIATIMAFMVLAGQALAQDCLNGQSPTAEQKTRRASALSLTRAINTAESAFASRNNGRYGSLKELLDSGALKPMLGKSTALNFAIDEPMLGWKLEFASSPEGYSFLVKDKIDPCGFSYYSNQVGLIYHGEPIR